MKTRPIHSKENHHPCDKVIQPQPELFGHKFVAPVYEDEADPRPFLGTKNPRHMRVIHVLLKQTAVPRSQIDAVAGCANGPDLITALRARGVRIPCRRVPCIDRDGKLCRPGLYRLTQTDRRKICRWLKVLRVKA